MQPKIKRLEIILNRFPSRGRFLFFILLSFSFWASTKLSNTYNIDQDFNLIWNSSPKGIILNNNKSKINLSISASGVQILWYRLFKNTIKLELKESDFTSMNGFVSIESQFFTIRKHLFDNTELHALNTENVKIEYSKLGAKKVKIFPNTSIKMRPGYLPDHQIICIPDSIWVRGSDFVLDTLLQIQTLPFVLNDAHEDFKNRIKLKTIDELQFDMDSIQIEQMISKYSEKEFKLPIKIVNLPKNLRVKLFPPSAKIKATLPLAILKGIKASDFSLVVDYNLIYKSNSNELPLSLIKRPKQVKKIIWSPLSVNYLIRK